MLLMLVRCWSPVFWCRLECFGFIVPTKPMLGEILHLEFCGDNITESRKQKEE